jgi:hypothetical protein
MKLPACLKLGDVQHMRGRRAPGSASLRVESSKMPLGRTMIAFAGPGRRRSSVRKPGSADSEAGRRSIPRTPSPCWTPPGPSAPSRCRCRGAHSTPSISGGSSRSAWRPRSSSVPPPRSRHSPRLDFPMSRASPNSSKPTWDGPRTTRTTGPETISGSWSSSSPKCSRSPTRPRRSRTPSGGAWRRPPRPSPTPGAGQSWTRVGGPARCPRRPDVRAW